MHSCSFDSLPMYLCIYMYVCMHVCMYICIYVCMYVCMYVRTIVCIYVRTIVCMYVRTIVCMCVQTIVCIYVRILLCVFVTKSVFPISRYMNRREPSYNKYIHLTPDARENALLVGVKKTHRKNIHYKADTQFYTSALGGTKTKPKVYFGTRYETPESAAAITLLQRSRDIDKDIERFVNVCMYVCMYVYANYIYIVLYCTYLI